MKTYENIFQNYQDKASTISPSISYGHTFHPLYKQFNEFAKRKQQESYRLAYHLPTWALESQEEHLELKWAHT